MRNNIRVRWLILIFFIVGVTVNCKSTRPDNSKTNIYTSTNTKEKPDGLLRWVEDDMQTIHLGAETDVLDDGRILVFGGSEDNSGEGTRKTEVYDPETNEWQTVGKLHDGRRRTSWTILSDGRLLISGGVRGGREILSSGEIYDPEKGTWQKASPMPQPRASHSVTALPDGRAFVIGGKGPENDNKPTRSKEPRRNILVYDAQDDSWEQTVKLEEPLGGHTVTYADGKVLVAGVSLESSIYQYKPENQSWEKFVTADHTRGVPRVWKLSKTRLLVSGWRSAEVYNLENDTWSSAGSPSEATPIARTDRPPTGPVLQLNRWDIIVFDKEIRTWKSLPKLPVSRISTSAVQTRDGEILIPGGVTINEKYHSNSVRLTRRPKEEVATEERAMVELPKEGNSAVLSKAINEQLETDEQHCLFFWGPATGELLPGKGNPIALESPSQRIPGQLLCKSAPRKLPDIRDLNVRGLAIVYWREGKFFAMHPHPTDRGEPFLEGNSNRPGSAMNRRIGQLLFRLDIPPQAPLLKLLKAMDFAGERADISMMRIVPSEAKRDPAGNE